MEEYVITEVDIEGYNRFILCLTCDSLLDHFHSIETSPLMANASGKVLIDQLLITGDGANRFLSCSFRDGKMDVSTAAVVNADIRFHGLTAQMLHDRFPYVEHSILTEWQRERIRNGMTFSE